MTHMVKAYAGECRPSDRTPDGNELVAAMAETLDADPMWLVDFFASPHFEMMDETDQIGAIEALLVALKKRRAKEPVRFAFDQAKSTWQAISDLLGLARESGKEGMVAQYLVGAILALRFPELTVENLSYSTADNRLGRPGDFYLGSTAFHVTVAPMPAVFEKCQKNIAEGYRVYLLVPDRAVIGARQTAEGIMSGRIAVESIESFVGNNVEELAQFSKDRLKEGMKRLIDEYNRRVNEVETDKSLLIDVPKNLL